MLVVDSNTWADYFNGTSSVYVERLDQALTNEEDLAILPVIITEVLQGFRSDAGFRHAEAVMTLLPVIQPDLGCHVRAAALFRSLRQRGISVRGAVDCIIAQVCIDSQSMLLSPDRDFRSLADHSALRLWTPEI